MFDLQFFKRKYDQTPYTTQYIYTYNTKQTYLHYTVHCTIYIKLYTPK